MFVQIYVYVYYLIYSLLASYTILLESFFFLLKSILQDFLYGRSFGDELFLFISKMSLFYLCSQMIWG